MMIRRFRRFRRFAVPAVVAVMTACCGCMPPSPEPEEPGVIGRTSERLGDFVRNLLREPPTEMEQAIIDAINAEREARDLAPLSVSNDLMALARRQSVSQASMQRMSHEDEKGGFVSDRAKAAGVDYLVVAENVARNLGYDDPAAEAVRAWMSSPGHRRNILHDEFEETGVGVVEPPHSEDGYFYFTQVFLRRMPE